MILVDTSIWVDHLASSNEGLARLLDDGAVLAHPFVIGELALGNLRRRDLVIGLLQDLPQAVLATDAEVLRFIEGLALYGLGIGYVDAHLLAAVRLTPGSALWTSDRRLFTVAESLALAWPSQAPL